MIAAQVVVVGLLVAIVVFTLLKPEGISPLHGVDAPGGQPAGGQPPNPTTHLPPAGQPNGGGNQTGPGAGGTSTSVAVAGIPISTPGGSAEGAGGGESSPTDDQYGDTLSLLMARLR